MEPCKAGDGRIRYPLGTIKDYNEYALLAFTHMDKLNRARLRRSEYEECLLNMWDELDRMYAGRPVVLPLLGSGITRFDGGKPSEDDLLRCMLCTLRASKRHFKEGVVVVLTEKTAARMRLYEVNGYIEAWENRIGEKDGFIGRGPTSLLTGMATEMLWTSCTNGTTATIGGFHLRMPTIYSSRAIPACPAA